MYGPHGRFNSGIKIGIELSVMQIVALNSM
jgi:hypothetical protein